MRGTHDVIAFHALRPGIIPAYARNTCRNDTRGCCTWDHPRVCGEHGTTLGSKRLKRGSSPRMRGTPSQTQCAARPSGIIPAYAGNTVTIMKNPSKTWDHPRVCGEHLTGNPYLLMVQGSSPRMRGTLGFSVTNTNDAGIIPAYAGNTVRACSLRLVMWDHPRVCGEHPRDTAPRVQTRGSSPRMRGTLRPQGRDAACPGIIPAYAGNTSPVPQSNSSASGSSPRMRGTLHSRNFITQLTGIIPAYAGNTFRPVMVGVRPRDHPRVCGEHEPLVPSVCDVLGSSPRMRGTQTIPMKTIWRIGDHPRVCGEHTLT